eukprot:NODE_1288_length_568_cov_16.778420_g1213_i0.p1 GENE.NODE_1288_length_568_cov_16.778420_g1213_i0~~NODE_1288_length_568_cov_16.778420_g1213_i0.p1  ORF type:complete len:151 (-),score=20.48 NODE_1288_length_568_cov_16.778420_g1213_i0:51-503(-)
MVWHCNVMKGGVGTIWGTPPYFLCFFGACKQKVGKKKSKHLLFQPCIAIEDNLHQMQKLAKNKCNHTKPFALECIRCNMFPLYHKKLDMTKKKNVWYHCFFLLFFLCNKKPQKPPPPQFNCHSIASCGSGSLALVENQGWAGYILQLTFR